MAKTVKNVIDKIKAQKIKPTPRWQFVFKNALIWSFFVFFALFGALAFSVIIYAFRENDFDVFPYFEESGFSLFLKMLPVVWLVFLACFFVFSIVFLKNTKKGYKFSILTVFLVNILLSIVLGSFVYVSGGAERMDRIFAEKVPFYKGLHEQRFERWQKPKEGFLAGEIISKDETILIIEDLRGETWIVYFEKAKIHPKADLFISAKIRALGKPLDKDTKEFFAIGILPFKELPHEQPRRIE